MKQQKNENKESGIAHVTLILLAIIVIAAIAFAGWWVWQGGDTQKNRNNQNDTAAQDTATNATAEQPSSETVNWVLATTQNRAFSIRVPDGWELTNFPGDYLGGVNVVYKPGNPAVIVNSDSEYVGHLLRFGVRIIDKADIGLEKPWESPQLGLEESIDDFVIGELKGKRYKGKFTYDLNETRYVYVFDLHNGKMLQASYVVYHNHDAKDDVEIAEKALKTLEIK